MGRSLILAIRFYGGGRPSIEFLGLDVCETFDKAAKTLEDTVKALAVIVRLLYPESCARWIRGDPLAVPSFAGRRDKGPGEAPAGGPHRTRRSEDHPVAP